jgi:hypothetical protein
MSIPLFIVTKNPGLLGFTGFGIIYLIIGAANNDKWNIKN